MPVLPENEVMAPECDVVDRRPSRFDWHLLFLIAAITVTLFSFAIKFMQAQEKIDAIEFRVMELDGINKAHQFMIEERNRSKEPGRPS
jgi:hypothetical protein